jgi:4-amino-4-deoxy-L-arabinose transferase-like glycosyltransferase
MAAVVVALSAIGLDRVPAYLHDAEVQFALHAHSIAATGYDTNGRFLPVYFQMPDIGLGVWFHPFLVYWTAPLLKVLPFSEATVRLATVLIGVMNVGLTYFVGMRLFRRRTLALFAAALTALMPVHFIHSRLAMDYLHPVPFILGWLWCLTLFEQHRRPAHVYAGCAILGLGVYSYIASVLMMVVYLLITQLYVWQVGGFNIRRIAAMLASFAAPLLPAAAWLAAHPTVIGETMGRYSSETSLSLIGLAYRVQAYLRYNALQEQIAVYWDYFNPGYLFFAGGSNVMSSTRAAGVFLIPFGVFLVVGLYRACAGRSGTLGIVLAAGFFTAPLGATLVGERYAVDRQLGIIPFAVFLGVLGFERLRSDPRSPVRWAAMALVLALPVQFTQFYRDYMGDYRIRSVGAFEYNIRGGVEEMIARGAEAPHFYLSTSIAYARAYWRFALAKAGVEEWDQRVSGFNPAVVEPEALPPGSLLLAHVEDRRLEELAANGRLRLVHAVPELGRDGLFLVYERR